MQLPLCLLHEEGTNRIFPFYSPPLLNCLWIRVTRGCEERVLERLAWVGMMLDWVGGIMPASDSHSFEGNISSKSCGDNGAVGTPLDPEEVSWSSLSKFIWLMKESSLINTELSFLLSLMSLEKSFSMRESSINALSLFPSLGTHFSEFLGGFSLGSFSELRFSCFLFFTLRHKTGELVASGDWFSSLPGEHSHLPIRSISGEQNPEVFLLLFLNLGVFAILPVRKTAFYFKAVVISIIESVLIEHSQYNLATCSSHYKLSTLFAFCWIFPWKSASNAPHGLWQKI